MAMIAAVCKHIRVSAPAANVFALAGCALLCFFLAACGSRSVVELAYPASGTLLSGQDAAKASPPSFCVVDFDNLRGNAAIGRYGNGDSMRPRTPVERWLAESVAGELARRGFAATTAETLDQALALKVSYIIAGEAEEVWIDQPSIARYASTIRMTLILMDGQGRHITANSYSGVFSQTALPGTNVPRSLLPAALQELLQPAVRLITQTVQTR